MTDVAIVGVGIHPFGRHKDVTGLDMGAVAARAALADAGLKWTDIDYVVRLFRITGDGTEVYTYGFVPADETAVS